MHSETAPGFVKHPNYKMDMVPAKKRYQLLYNGEMIAQSDNVIELGESKHDTRLYFPKADIQMTLLQETDHSSYCPFKGTARYWTIRSKAGDLENGVWAYDNPYKESQEVEGHLSFYLEKQGFELREI